MKKILEREKELNLAKQQIVKDQFEAELAETKQNGILKNLRNNFTEEPIIASVTQDAPIPSAGGDQNNVKKDKKG